MLKPSRYLALVVVLLMSYYIVPLAGQNDSALVVDVGVIVDADSISGKISQTCMMMALEDFYAAHTNHTTRIVLHNRDSKSDVVEAASAAVDLMKNVGVQAILGPQRSTQADFVIGIGNKTRVPILSPATNPSLSPTENPYFIRVAQNGSSQVEALTSIVKAFNWREVVLIYENKDYGSGVVPHLTDALQGISTQVRHRSVLSLTATDDHILQELYKLMTMQTRVFVVHMLPTLASRLFLKAKEVGMMRKEYVWIITDGLTTLLDTLDPTVVNSMQGVLGVKPYVPKSSQLEKFTERWRKRFRQENPETDRFELNLFGLWAYDSVTALAMAADRVGVAQISGFKKPVTTKNLTDLAALGTSEMGPRLLESIKNSRFTGLSGEFHLVDRQLQSSAFQIINVIGKGENEIGFWTPEFGILKNLTLPSNKNYTINREDLGTIIWPGDSNVTPKGWEIPTSEKKLRVGVPVKSGFTEFIKVERDSETKEVIVTGFCIDLLQEVMDSLPYAVQYKFIPFETPNGKSAGSYNDLVYGIFQEKYDAVVGDVTIVANRSRFVDFTMPYTESGVAMIVRIEDDGRKNAWIFMKPLTMDLWLTTGAFFIFTGFVVWVLEHRVNKEFRGPPRQQVGMIFWFSFSTLVFAHKEKVISNLSRFVVIVWVFVVLVLTSSYTASLTSRLTVQKLKPTVTDIRDLIKNEDCVGYQKGSFVAGLLTNIGFHPSKLKNYSTLEEYDDALSRGSRNGGVAAIIDEIPYIRLFLARYCTKYTLVGPIHKTTGFGFAFPKGSPLVPEISRAIINMKEGDKMIGVEKKWFGKEADCSEQEGTRVVSDSLTLGSFKGLFLVSGISSVSSLIIFVFMFLYVNKDILASNASIWQKIMAMAKTFDEEEENSSSTASKKTLTTTSGGVVAVPAADCPLSPATGDHHNAECVFSQDEGFSTTEPATPTHDTIEIVHTNMERQK
ncbi:Glutamate receptor 2.8 like [Actinidia chinensis var. chinensis]|uniref:Glutamate receptor n=1 Tax=Actinidia chinensis var. chinensis TaxID=1590841 RepID=A0A2R6QF44_ACTCC|nr:Glutamate receptor 2.8 like [Actinidia chinensis var. chinensis]